MERSHFTIAMNVFALAFLLPTYTFAQSQNLMFAGSGNQPPSGPGDLIHHITCTWQYEGGWSTADLDMFVDGNRVAHEYYEVEGTFETHIEADVRASTQNQWVLCTVHDELGTA